MKKTSSLSCGIISIVMALISFFIFGWLSISGLILSIFGLVTEMKNRKEFAGNSGGLITCIIGLILSAIMFVLYIIALTKVSSLA